MSSDNNTVFDLVNLYEAFLSSDKEIWTNNIGTGIGKGYAFIKTACQRAVQGKHTIYITERLENVYEHFSGVCSQDGFNSDCAVMLKSETDELVDNRNELCKLRSIIEKNPKNESYGNSVSLITDMINTLDMFEKIKKTSDETTKSIIMNNVLLKNKELQVNLRSVYKKIIPNKKISYSEQIDILKKHPVFSCVIKIYSAIRLFDAKIIFLTAQKSIFPINTVLFGVISIHEACKEYNEPFVFVDESDSVKVALVNSFAETSNKNNLNMKDLLTNLKTAADQIVAHEMPRYFYQKNKNDEDEGTIIIEKTASEFIKSYNNLNHIYGLNWSHIISPGEDSGGFMYHSRLQIIRGTEDLKEPRYRCLSKKNQYVIRDTDEMIMRIKTDSDEKKKLIEDKLIDSGKMRDLDERKAYFIDVFIIRMQECCSLGMKMLRTALNCEVEHNKLKNEKTEVTKEFSDTEMINGVLLQSCAANIIKKLMPLDDKDIDVYTELILDYKKEKDWKDKSIRDDFYYYGFDLISIFPKGDIDTAFRYYFFLDTPEKWLIKFIESGAKIILSSATGSLRGAYSNFDLDYSEIKSRLWILPEELEDNVIDYVNSIQQNMGYYKENLKICSFLTSFDKGEEKIIRRTKLVSTVSIYLEELSSKLFDLSEKFDNFNNSMTYFKIETILQSLLEQNGDKDINYFHFERSFGMFISLLDAWISGNNVCLYITTFSPTKDDKDSIDINYYNGLKKIMKILKDDFSDAQLRNPCFFEIDSRNIKEEIKKANESISKDNFVILSTCYESFMKGINPKIVIPKTMSDEYYYINNRGKLEFEKDLFVADIDCLIFCKPRYMCPSVNGDELISSTAKCLYFAESLFAKKMITTEQREQLLRYSITGNPFANKSGFNDISTDSNLANMMRNIIQLIGRLGRTGIKRKGVSIYVDNEIVNEVNKLKSLKRIGINKSLLKQQSPEVREVLKFFLEHEKVEFLSTDNIVKNVNNADRYAMNIVYGNFEESNNVEKYERVKRLKELQNVCKKITLTQKEYEDLPQNMKVMFIPKPDNRSGYCVKWRNQDDKRRECMKISPLKNRQESSYSVEYLKNKTKSSVSTLMKDALNNNNIRINDVEDSVYILTPKGFDFLKGNIGEAGTEEFFSIYYPELTLESLDDAVYERMDFFCRAGKSLLYIDSKFYDNASAIIREERGLAINKNRFIAKYALKRKFIKNYYDKKFQCDNDIVFLIINMVCDDSLKDYDVVNCILKDSMGEDLKCIIVPNILDINGKVAYEPLQKLHMALKKYVEV